MSSACSQQRPLQQGVPQRQRVRPVRHRQLRHPAPGERHRPHQRVRLVPPRVAQAPLVAALLQRPPERLRPLGRPRTRTPLPVGVVPVGLRPVGVVLAGVLPVRVPRVRPRPVRPRSVRVPRERAHRVGALPVRDHRVVEAHGRGHQAVHRQQMADHPGDVRRPARRTPVGEPPQPHRRVPLRAADVLEQRVQPRGLRVVRTGPRRDGDARRAAAQAVVQDPGAQQRVQVEVPLVVEQPHRVAQPQRLLRTRRALRQVVLDGRRLLGGAGGQRPRPEQGAQQRVRLLGGLRPPLRAVAVLDAGHSGFPPEPGGDPSSGPVCAVDSSCSPSRSRRRASASVTPRCAAVCR
ncbi:hypothetical protein BG846_02042 [Streptomyces fradiae ATCC 10745 = DSM 40063]|uniref:Uncharacterized protein n=1 Tax=Streptomyces fradiae ATCC 10745 = DSM 40063 TaxID=1319510 RepID=A0A1Y2NXQ7_STRFR|nr:hypothetical protein BG846_02042 [Streptomyces fradiae ATCC 10745 = DSM 40063]